MKITVPIICALGLLLGLTELEQRTAKAAEHKNQASSPNDSPPPGNMGGLVFENESVRVIRIVLGPHARIPMHEVTPRLVVWATDGHLRVTFPDGTSKEEEHKAGEAGWVGAQRHAGENLGEKPIILVAVILKEH